MIGLLHPFKALRLQEKERERRELFGDDPGASEEEWSHGDLNPKFHHAMVA